MSTDNSFARHRIQKNRELEVRRIRLMTNFSGSSSAIHFYIFFLDCSPSNFMGRFFSGRRFSAFTDTLIVFPGVIKCFTINILSMVRKYVRYVFRQIVVNFIGQARFNSWKNQLFIPFSGFQSIDMTFISRV